MLFVINTKNYLEISGKQIDKFASAVEQTSNAIERCPRSKENSLSIYLAVPALCLSKVTSTFPHLNIICQHLDDEEPGSTTGYLVPEMAKAFGAKGSILNHSEHRIPFRRIQRLVKKLQELEMLSIVCARNKKEVARFATLGPDFVAIEPPELIGSGNAVSKANPAIISESRKALEELSYKERIHSSLLCGAGIVSPLDAKLSVELGAEGILVASGVIKAANWRRAIEGLSEGLISADRKRRV